jgi:hypothetical protein
MNDSDAEVSKASKPHSVPTTPGWELLRDAALIVVSAGDNVLVVQKTTLIANLIARENEFIPGNHRAEVINLVISAGSELFEEQEWDYEVTAFLHSQLGVKDLEEYLIGLPYVLHPCDYGPTGYEIIPKTAVATYEAMSQLEEALEAYYALISAR